MTHLLENCKSCDYSCSACYGGTPSECYTTTWRYSYDGSTVQACQSPCLFCWGDGGHGNCYLCDGGFKLNTNGYCSTTCTAPYTTFGDSFPQACLISCASNQFMLWNYTCTDFCDPLLVQRATSQGTDCIYPCGSSIKSFLYWNGSCLETCPFLPRVEGDSRFCDVCPPGGPKYYYPDQAVCKATCSYPYTIQNIVFCELVLSSADQNSGCYFFQHK